MKRSEATTQVLICAIFLGMVFVPEGTSQALDRTVYLVSSQQEKDVKIYSVSESSLTPALVRGLDGGDFPPEINVDLVHRLATVSFWDAHKIVVNVIQMNTPVAPLTFNIDTGDRTVLGGNLLNSPVIGLVQSFRLGGSSTRLRSIGEKPEFSKWALITLGLSGRQAGTVEANQSFEEGRYVVVSGSSGPGLADDGAEVFIGNDGALSISIAGRKLSLPLDLPPREFKQAKYLGLSVSNDSFAAVVLTPAAKAQAAGREIFFFDKIAKTWSSMTVAADSVWVRSLGGNWVGVLEGERTRDPRESGGPESPSRKFDDPDDRYRRDFRDSPGLSRKEAKESSTTDFARERFKRTRAFSSGNLTLYNFLTKQKYSIHTGQGDSELLLVDGERIYYRVNQDLYRSTLAGGQLTEPVLLAHGDVVAGIHWAFSSVP